MPEGEAINKLATLFKITEVQAKKFLASGNAVVKKSVSVQDAEKYRVAIERCGVVVCVEPEFESNLEFDLPSSLDNKQEKVKSAAGSNDPENLIKTKNSELTLRQKINRYGGFVFLGLMGFGLLNSVMNPVDKNKTSPKQTGSVEKPRDGMPSVCVGGALSGSCIINPDGNTCTDDDRLGELIRNGNYTVVNLEEAGGYCVATVHIQGVLRGSSISKTVKMWAYVKK